MQSGGRPRAAAEFQYTFSGGGTRPPHWAAKQLEGVVDLPRVHNIQRLECNNTLKALPQFPAQLHDLLKPTVMATRAKNDGKDAEAANNAEAASSLSSLNSNSGITN